MRRPLIQVRTKAYPKAAYRALELGGVLSDTPLMILTFRARVKDDESDSKLTNTTTKLTI